MADIYEYKAEYAVDAAEDPAYADELETQVEVVREEYERQLPLGRSERREL